MATPVSGVSGRGRFRGLKGKKKSNLSIILKVVVGWLPTLAISLGLYAAIHFYSEQISLMQSVTKRLFNALVTGLSISLGLSVTRGLDEIVCNMRWWILSRRYSSLRKVELIMGSDSVLNIILIALKTSRLTIHATALVWFLLIAGAQIAVAILGLCYSIEDSNKMALLIDSGNVYITNMSSIPTLRLVSTSLSSKYAKQFAANSYGQLSLAYPAGDESEIPQKGSIWSPSDPLIFCSSTHCSYVFHETSAMENADSASLIVTTARTINSSTVCESWRVTSDNVGTTDLITILTKAGDSQTVRIPVQGGLNQTTYITNTTTSCGPGCSIVDVLEVNQQAWYYRCNVSVGTVEGASLPEHHVGVELREMASGGIALQGYGASSLQNNTEVQYQMYPSESLFGVPFDGDTDARGRLIARFAIGVVAMAANSNPAIIVRGYVPQEGYELKVEHGQYLRLILILVTGLQLFLGVAAAVVANQVVIPTGGPVAIAKVLRSVTSNAEDENCKNGRRWIYKCDLVSADGVYDLYMDESGTGTFQSSDAIEM